MKNSPFLQQVAKYYANSGRDLSSYTMVLPNNRSAKFMAMYLKKAMKKVGFLPNFISITDFAREFCTRQVPSNFELLFILYQSYEKVLKEKKKAMPEGGFDQFAFWGNIILKDFNDIDAYLVEANQIFRNLKDYESLESNYLSPEQLKVIEAMWGRQNDYDPVNFWKHVPTEPTPHSLSHEFTYLWEILGDLYKQFNEELNAQNPPIAYSGLQSKMACEKICSMGKDDFRGKRYAFVGFSVLSTARFKIFKHLRDQEAAEFFWDTASPFLSDKEMDGSNAARLIMRFAEEFKSPTDFDLDPIVGKPNLEIVAVPSNVGQAKVIDAKLNQWGKDGIVNNDTLLETGIVLPDTMLLTPVLNSLPEWIQAINITMGIPYLNTETAMLLDSIMAMQHRAKNRSNGSALYFANDVEEVLSHQLCIAIDFDNAKEIKKHISENHLYLVNSNDLQNLSVKLSPIFKPLSNSSINIQVSEYLLAIIKLLQELPNKSNDRYHHSVLKAFSDAINDISELAQSKDIQMDKHTFYSMLRKQLSGQEIMLSGDPLKGLQIMDVMDSRLLDFDNIIIPSVNERIFPRKSFTPSIIPPYLRHCYNLPTQEHEEGSTTYQFYRLISRASNIVLTYDSRTEGLSSGEASRFISQILNLDYPANITEVDVNTAKSADKKREITISKTDNDGKVMKEVQKLLAGGPLSFSASALKDYVKCSLLFYLKYVKRLHAEDSNNEFIDAASYGSILHEVAEYLYNKVKNQLITEDVLRQMAKRPLREMVLEHMDSLYYKLKYADNLQDIPGEGQVIAEIIAEYIKAMLEAEIKFMKERDIKSFVFISAEDDGSEAKDNDVDEGLSTQESGNKKHKSQKVHEWEVEPGIKINFKMSIDRIDKLDDAGQSLRFIDYKTGKDCLNASGIESLFNYNPSSNLGGFFQVMVYCLAYSEIKNYKGAIYPMIYRLNDMATSGIQPLTIKQTNPKTGKDVKDDLVDFNNIRVDFKKKFQELIREILDPQTPFSQTTKEDACKYCNFKIMCRRFPKDYN